MTKKLTTYRVKPIKMPKFRLTNSEVEELLEVRKSLGKIKDTKTSYVGNEKLHRLQSRAYDLWRKDTVSAYGLGIALLRVKLAMSWGPYGAWLSKMNINRNRADYCTRLVYNKDNNAEEIKAERAKKLPGVIAQLTRFRDEAQAALSEAKKTAAAAKQASEAKPDDKAAKKAAKEAQRQVDEAKAKFYFEADRVSKAIKKRDKIDAAAKTDSITKAYRGLIEAAEKGDLDTAICLANMIKSFVAERLELAHKHAAKLKKEQHPDDAAVTAENEAIGARLDAELDSQFMNIHKLQNEIASGNGHKKNGHKKIRSKKALTGMTFPAGKPAAAKQIPA